MLCGWRQKFAPGRGSPENWKSGQRGRESGAQRACLGVLGPWTRGGQRSWRGQGASYRGSFAVTAARVSSALVVSLGKVLGWIAAGTLSHPSSLLGHLRRATPSRPRSRPARCPPSPARPGARGAEPITSARAWPASCSRSRGCGSRETRATSGAPPPHRPSSRKVTSRGIPGSMTRRNSHTLFLRPQLLPVSCTRKNFRRPFPLSPISCLVCREALPTLFCSPFL